MSYEDNGYLLIRDFLVPEEVASLAAVVDRFHLAWLEDNNDFYQQRAVNSAYLTGQKYLKSTDRSTLFRFIGSNKLHQQLLQLPFDRFAFMGSQLFFDPYNSEQKNYWHRDPQYHLSVEQQKVALVGPEVIHFRFALKDEPGIEVIPGSHKNWDTEQELNVRLEQGGHKNHEDLNSGVTIPLNSGDLLVFSANMIHRGLYGNDRKALDILFCEALPELVEFVPEDCLPDKRILASLDNGESFRNSLTLKKATDNNR